MSGGLTLCTLFPCIAVPLAYALLDMFAQWSGSVFGRAVQRAEAVESPLLTARMPGP